MVTYTENIGPAYRLRWLLRLKNIGLQVAMVTYTEYISHVTGQYGVPAVRFFLLAVQLVNFPYHVRYRFKCNGR